MRNLKNIEDEAVRQMSRIFHYAGRKGSITQGEIVSVNKENNTCIVSIDGQQYANLPLKVFYQASNFVVYPKAGTPCDVFFYEGNVQSPSVLDFQDAESIMVSGQTAIDISADQITLNGGQNGGLVMINELTQKLNDLVTAFNAHTHAVATTGTATEQTGTAAPTTNTANPFVASDYENNKITQ